MCRARSHSIARRSTRRHGKQEHGAERRADRRRREHVRLRVAHDEHVGVRGAGRPDDRTEVARLLDRLQRRRPTGRARDTRRGSAVGGVRTTLTTPSGPSRATAARAPVRSTSISRAPAACARASSAELRARRKQWRQKYTCVDRGRSVERRAERPDALGDAGARDVALARPVQAQDVEHARVARAVDDVVCVERARATPASGDLVRAAGCRWKSEISCATRARLWARAHGGLDYRFNICDEPTPSARATPTRPSRRERSSVRMRRSATCRRCDGSGSRSSCGVSTTVVTSPSCHRTIRQVPSRPPRAPNRSDPSGRNRGCRPSAILRTDAAVRVRRVHGVVAEERDPSSVRRPGRCGAVQIITERSRVSAVRGDHHQRVGIVRLGRRTTEGDAIAVG